MYYIIYRIINKTNGFIYIGQHTTSNLNDGYMGSGLRLWNAYNKYGKDIFIKDILFVFDNFYDMDIKEAELVNEEFIRRHDTYNIVLGGSGWCSSGTVVVESIDNPGQYFRIPREQYNINRYRTPTTGTTQVYIKTTGEKIRISSQEYKNNRYLYNTISTGKVSVKNKITGNTLSILVDDFNPDIHMKIFGGIVIEDNGIKKYVSSNKFYSENLSGIHKGKVTVFDRESGIMCHISQYEYYENRNRYLTNGTGKTLVKDPATGISSRIDRNIIKNNENWIIGTTGQTTVYDIGQKKFINIPRGTYDKDKHKLAQDRKIICYNSDRTIRFEFWGGKKEFLEKYKCPRSVWNAAINQTIFKSDRKSSANFNGCYFTLVNWKSPNNGY